ncbi:NAD(P)-dependent oxidoreductase [Chloroflexota bacterium]
MQVKKVGFIGLGEMGAFMAKNLVKKGFDLSVYDVMKEPVEELRTLGARVADSCQEVAEVSDVIISMVRDGFQTEDVLHGKNGVWEGVRRGSVIIISSTIAPLHCQRIAAEGIEAGIRVLDAPVSGGRTGAEAGTLTVMVGGDKRDFEECRPIFEAMGKNIYYVGSAGMAEVTKLVNNLLCFINLAGLSDAIALGLKAGLELETLLNVIRVSTGDSHVAQNWDFVLTLTKEYSQRRHGSTFDILYKDMELALKMAKELDQFLPVAGLCSQLDIAQFFPGVER